MRMRFALGLLAALGACGRPAPAPDVDVATLRSVADRFDQAQIAQDAKAMDRLIADDLIFLEGDGKRTDKRAFIDGWVDPSLRFDPLVIEDRTFVPLGPDAGVVSGRVKLSGTAGGTAFARTIRFADTFHRRDGQWRTVQVQVTRLP